LKTVSRRTQFSSSALPPMGSREASPKTISRKTSYHRVRLEFLSYPQLISACCTAREFGPPVCFRRRSSWPWIAHPVSGYVHATLSSPFQTRFRFASTTEWFKRRHTAYSQAHSSIGTRSPLRAPALCKHTVSDTISSPSPGYFSPFPHGTRSLSVTKSI
jgi:hypothetical protein